MVLILLQRNGMLIEAITQLTSATFSMFSTIQMEFVTCLKNILLSIGVFMGLGKSAALAGAWASNYPGFIQLAILKLIIHRRHWWFCTGPDIKINQTSCSLLASTCYWTIKTGDAMDWSFKQFLKIIYFILNWLKNSAPSAKDIFHFMDTVCSVFRSTVEYVARAFIGNIALLKMHEQYSKKFIENPTPTGFIVVVVEQEPIVKENGEKIPRQPITDTVRCWIKQEEKYFPIVVPEGRTEQTYFMRTDLPDRKEMVETWYIGSTETHKIKYKIHSFNDKVVYQYEEEPAFEEIQNGFESLCIDRQFSKEETAAFLDRKVDTFMQQLMNYMIIKKVETGEESKVFKLLKQAKGSLQTISDSLSSLFFSRLDAVTKTKDDDDVEHDDYGSGYFFIGDDDDDDGVVEDDDAEDHRPDSLDDDDDAEEEEDLVINAGKRKTRLRLVTRSPRYHCKPKRRSMRPSRR
jgi:hypothetical protein